MAIPLAFIACNDPADNTQTTTGKGTGPGTSQKQPSTSFEDSYQKFCDDMALAYKNNYKSFTTVIRNNKNALLDSEEPAKRNELEKKLNAIEAKAIEDYKKKNPNWQKTALKLSDNTLDNERYV